ncbi:hypothetical protein O53_4097 [Microcystis aeruginosa TAIHU98]|uniref:Uncharacterized protein n=1 Tax=Microcystis aeruginosa TAIHU98 TaxID=1134457 RepID=L7E8R5_MICAE|nr:hypothetical protein O53_4097 [Microcystis aeruginosa TAIHU98]
MAFFSGLQFITSIQGRENLLSWGELLFYSPKNALPFRFLL